MAKRRLHRPEGTPTVTRGRPSTRSPKPRQPFSAEPTSPRRQRFERASAPWLVRMGALPPFVIPALMAVGLFFGLVVHSPWVAILLLIIAAFLGWLAALSWPNLSTSSRALRLLVVGGLTWLAVFKILGRF